MKNKMHDEYILCSLYIGVENGEGVGGLSQPPFFAQIPPPLDVNAVPQTFKSHVVHGCGSHVIM